MAAWFGLANHCALGNATAPFEEEAEAGSCPMHTAPVKEKPAAKLPCCKDVRAVVAKSIVAAPIFRLSGGEEFAAFVVIVPPRYPVEVRLLDTGPPGYFSFAESVLQESMLSHAPPLS